jgi:hypothetical protein
LRRQVRTDRPARPHLASPAMSVRRADQLRPNPAGQPPQSAGLSRTASIARGVTCSPEGCPPPPPALSVRASAGCLGDSAGCRESRGGSHDQAHRYPARHPEQRRKAPGPRLVLPERLKGQAARNTVERLISRGLVEEVRATGELPVWRHDDQGSFALRSPGAGLCAIGIEPEVEGTSERRSDSGRACAGAEGPEGACGRSRQERCSAEREQAGPDHWPSLPRRRRNPRRHHRCHGWLPHTARAALTGLRHKGYALTSERRRAALGPTASPLHPVRQRRERDAHDHPRERPPDRWARVLGSRPCRRHSGSR